jgi:hypothetical protein
MGFFARDLAYLNKIFPQARLGAANPSQYSDMVLLIHDLLGSSYFDAHTVFAVEDTAGAGGSHNAVWPASPGVPEGHVYHVLAASMTIDEAAARSGYIAIIDILSLTSAGALVSGLINATVGSANNILIIPRPILLGPKKMLTAAVGDSGVGNKVFLKGIYYDLPIGQLPVGL